MSVGFLKALCHCETFENAVTKHHFQTSGQKEFQQFSLSVPNTATAQVCTSADVTWKWALGGICCPEHFRTKKSTFSLNPCMYLAVPGWGSEIPNTEHGCSCLQNRSFERFMMEEGCSNRRRSSLCSYLSPNANSVSDVIFTVRELSDAIVHSNTALSRSQIFFCHFYPAQRSHSKALKRKKNIHHTTASRQLTLNVSI